MIIKKKLTERDKLEYLTHGGRTKLNRRDFLTRSTAAAVGYVMAPSIFSLIAKRAYGEDLNCPNQGGGNANNNMMAHLEYAAGGGFPLCREFVCVGPSRENGDFLKSYEKYAIPDDQGPTKNGFDPNSTIAGLDFHNGSQLMKAFDLHINPGVKEHMATMAIAVQCSSDTTQNQLSITHSFAQLGLTGSVVPLIGNSTLNPGGGRHALARGTQDPSIKSTLVKDPDTARSIGGYNQALVDRLGTPDRAQAVLEAMKNLSVDKINTLKNKFTVDDQAKVLAKCGYMNAKELPFRYKPDELYNAADPDLVAAFGDDVGAVHACIAELVANRYAGVGVIAENFYDTHDGTALTSNDQGLFLGKKLAQIVNYFDSKNQPLHLNCTTDGTMGVLFKDGVIQVEDVGDGVLRAKHPGDNSLCAILTLVYDPNRSASDFLVKQNQAQVGYFDENGVVLDSSIAANNPSNAALASLYNYLALNNMTDKMSTLQGMNGKNPFERKEEDYLIFKPKA